MKKRNFVLRGFNAFTLAEVLITLVIIGVIGALTVPALIQNTQKQEYVSALKKAYSTLSQATQAIIAEEGSPKADENGVTWMTSLDAVYDMYKQYLSNAKECKGISGCYSQGVIKCLSGAANCTNNIDTESNYKRNLVLADGMQIAVDIWYDKTCSKNWVDGNENSCASLIVDVNGAKAPNRLGRDTFAFVLKENGLYLSGCSSNSHDCVQADGTLGRGWTCACKVLTEGAMNY